MIIAFVRAFSFLCLMLGAFDFWFAYRSFRQPEEIGRWLGYAGMAGGIVTVSYAVSILSADYRIVSAASSIYFAGIDWMLVALVHFVYCFTGTKTYKYARLIRQCIRLYALFDTAVFAVNIFREIAVHYVPGPLPGAPYVYEMKPLYLMHLGFTYVLVAVVLYILAQKAFSTPRQYRNPYILNMLAIVLVVIVNAIFLYPEEGTLLSTVDCSVTGYSLALYLMYWAAFKYRNTDMLRSLSMMIFENIDQGIVLFDYEDRMIMSNQKAEKLLAGVQLSGRGTVREFLKSCRIADDVLKEKAASTQCDRLGSGGGLLRCDYRRLADASGGMIGTLFVFTDASASADLLTGFRHWDEFRDYAGKNPYLFDHPTTAVIFDLAGLAEINNTFGREVGDLRIRNLAEAIRQYMPEDSDFVRGYEAHLVAICRGASEADVKARAELVAGSGKGTVFYGMASTADGAPDPLYGPEENGRRNIIQAIETAGRALRAKKLLNSNSYRSQSLASLLRALRESDVDTEAHVLRTRKMGAALAEKIGLSDAETADLCLLCMLHDIGKIGIPLEILNKPGELTPQEWNMLRSHVEKGYQIAMSTDEFRHIARMILYHHECWNGSGYPEKLTGNRIPLLSRIIAIVDAYDAMVNNRSYRKGMDPEQAEAELENQSGKQFDPFLTGEFLQVLREHPELARGEKTGGEEIRTFGLQEEAPSEMQGNTRRIPYSRYLLDIDDRIIETDDAFEILTGYPREEAVGKLSQYDLIPEDDREFYRARVGEFFRKGTIAYLKHELLRRDGSRIWVVCCGKRYFDSAEKAFRSEILVYRSSGPEL